MKKLSAVAVLTFFFLSCRVSGISQTAPNLENGFKPYGSYDGSKLDTVNLMNGNLMLHAPLIPDPPQRGSIKVGNTLYLTSKDWQVVCTAPSGSGPNCSWKKGGTGINVQVTPALTVHRTLNKSFGGGGGTTIQEAYGYSIVTADQGSHSLHGVAGTEDINLEPTQFDSTDLTGFHLALSNPDPSSGVFSHAIVTDRNGARYEGDFTLASGCGQAPKGLLTSSPDGTQLTVDNLPFGDQYCSETAFATLMTDSNGNQVSLRTPGHPVPGVDTLDKSIFPAVTTVTSDYSGCVSSHAINGAMIYSYQDPNGVTQNIKFCQAEVPIHTAFNASNGSGGTVKEAVTGVDGLDFQPIVTVVLPDKTVWTFDYDSYGEVTSIGLPTGGSIQYQWQTVNSLNCNGGVISTQYSRAVARRTLIDALGNSSPWNYTWGTATASSLTNVVNDPAGNDTVHVFSEVSPLAGLPAACKFFETSTIEYQGSQAAATPLQRTDTAYSATNIAIDNSGDVNFPDAGNVFATDITTTVYPSRKVKKVHRDPDTGLGAGLPGFGNVVKELEYDWGQGVPGSLLRETDTVYKWQKDTAYRTAGLLDLPVSRVVISPLAGANPKTSCPVSPSSTANCMAETDYTYDEPAYLTSPSPGGSVQHVAPPNGVRGNLTTTSSWLSSPNSFVSSHTNWYDTGEPYQKIDPLGHTTTLSYDPAYAGGYVTQTCSPTTGTVTHCVSGTYDFTTGMLNSLTDQNGQTSNYTYDSMFHIATAQAPLDQANGARATNTFTYSDMASPPTLPLTMTRVKSVTNALSDSVTATLDGLGRSILSQHATPSGTVTVSTSYDDVHGNTTVTNPYYSISDATYGSTTTHTDALGRPLSVTEQDGSIKYISYDVVPLAGALGNCNLTKDETGNLRRSCSDALGRLIEVDEPNPGATPSYAQATVIVSGTEQATAQSGVAGTGYVDIGGSEGTSQSCTDPEPPALPHCTTVPDSGSVSIQVGSYPAKVETFGTGYTAASLAGKLAADFHNDAASPVDAVISPSSNIRILFTARSLGAATNYTLTVNPLQATATDFWGTPSGSALINGRDATTSPDTGTATITLNGTSYQISYSGSDTSSSIATRLATAISAGSWANAAAAGGTITLTAKNAGPGGDYSLSAPPTTFDSVHFPGPSFAVSAQASALSGGYNAGDVDNQPFRTLYSYDALGNLLCVEQHGNVSGTGCSAPPLSDATSPWRVRRFTYDSLSRLLTAHNPESGTITYSYDLDGNLLQKTSPLANAPINSTATTTISYCYDSLHRVLAKGYANSPSTPQQCLGAYPWLPTPAATYTYDSGAIAKGKLTSLTDQAGSASYTYDPLGRMTSETRVINSVSKTMSYDYNLDGSIKTIHYPSGAAVTYTPDSAGRLLSAVDSSNNINYVTGTGYQADGQLTSFISGNGAGFAGITSTFNFNKRLQPINMSASAPSQTVFSIGYDFHVGNGTSGADNGNVWGITNYKDNTRNQSFTYDSLNRLTSAQNAGTANPPPPSDCNVLVLQGKTKYWGNNYGYDAWGNLTSKTVTKCSAENLSAPSLANNQLSGYGYDAAGNMTTDPTDGLTLTYDQENRITGAGGYTYTYDADGNRVKKTNGSTGTLYWYMAPGIVAESDLLGVLKSEYVFFDGERVARRDNPTGTSPSVAYYFSDHLKTASVITDSQGNIKSESDYYPWGGELQFIAGDSNHYKFTGKERDETGLDYFGARYYSNGMGRFITPDWAAKATAVPYAEFADPQSLNLYTYVRNVPTTKVDVDGHVVLVDDAAIAVTAFAAIAITIYISQPAQQRSIVNATSAAVSTISGWLHKSPPPSVPATGVNTQTPPTTATSVPGTTTQSVDQATKGKIKDNAGGKCEYCGKTTTTTADTARGKAPAGDEGQTDHYCPKCKGGTDDESNLVHACRDCNGPGGKGAADPTDPNDAAGQKWRLPRMEKDSPKQ